MTPRSPIGASERLFSRSERARRGLSPAAVTVRFVEEPDLVR
jgi:hypothetical protein